MQGIPIAGWHGACGGSGLIADDVTLSAKRYLRPVAGSERDIATRPAHSFAAPHVVRTA